MKNIKITIIYPYFAHYREPIFDELNNNLNNYFVEYIGDSEANLPSLKTINFNDKFNFFKAKNIWFGKWLWQHGLFFKLLKSRPESIIFLGQFNILSTWFNAIFFKMTGTKIYFWGHGCYGNEKGLKKIIRRVFNKIPHMHLLYGHYAKSLLVESGWNQDKLKVIYNSLDYEKQKKILARLKGSCKLTIKATIFNKTADLPLLIFIGRLTSVKKLELLIESVYIANKRGTHCNCVIIGTGPEFEKLQKLSLKLGVSKNIKFFGECHDENIIGDLIYSSDLCVSPGNVGLTAIHSLSYGTPVITHNDFGYQMPEFEAIKPDLTGSFYEFGSIDSLVNCISFWINLPQDVKDSNSQECIKVIDSCYNPKKQAELIFEALDSLI
jgi:glycosyltransferase involved in cell wall biosynthesis